MCPLPCASSQNDDGEAHVDDSLPGRVPYLIFEQAEGDISCQADPRTGTVVGPPKQQSVPTKRSVLGGGHVRPDLVCAALALISPGDFGKALNVHTFENQPVGAVLCQGQQRRPQAVAM